MKYITHALSSPPQTIRAPYSTQRNVNHTQQTQTYIQTLHGCTLRWRWIITHSLSHSSEALAVAPGKWVMKLSSDGRALCALTDCTEQTGRRRRRTSEWVKGTSYIHFSQSTKNGMLYCIVVLRRRHEKETVTSHHRIFEWLPYSAAQQRLQIALTTANGTSVSGRAICSLFLHAQ